MINPPNRPTVPKRLTALSRLPLPLPGVSFSRAPGQQD